MTIKRLYALCAAAVLVAGCGGSSGGASGSFALIEFLDSGKNQIPRNRPMEFRFSRPVAQNQDFSERLRIQNIQAEGPDANNFSKAIGTYFVNGEIVQFMPALPTKSDRSDAGLRADANYHVFVKSGPDALRADSGESLPRQQEFLFDTNGYFEDATPNEPPRVLGLRAIDSTNGVVTDLSRVDPRPFEQAKMDNATLAGQNRVIAPGAGGSPFFATPWRFELTCSEAIDPSTITAETIQMHEIRSGAFTTAPDTADEGHMGEIVNHRVPIRLAVEQGLNDSGQLEIRVIVTPVQTLVDNTRYRIQCSGQILGIDYRKTFVGDNGVTGDGTTVVNGGVYAEPGGLGYVSEFLVSDEPGIDASRTLLYDPFLDGIQPEGGQTANSEEDINSALYNPASDPGSAVGFLSAFGKGTDGPLAASGSGITPIDTGDTPNAPLGNPFTVHDLNPTNDYLGNPLPGGELPFDSVEPFELQLESLTISPAATLRVTGVNPIVFRVTGIVQISGTLDVSGEDGEAAHAGNADGGKAGAGGFIGADSRRGDGSSCLPPSSSSCQPFASYLNQCSSAKAIFPTAKNGEGPGRGLAGGEIFAYPYNLSDTAGSSGGGGASHARPGTAGEDRKNTTAPEGTRGGCDTQYTYNRVSLSGVVGVRGQFGPTYGDRDIEFNTMGGSGGGAGGAHYQYLYAAATSSGGAGGGGGGSLAIVSAGEILLQGGRIDASGGDGGKGRFYDAYKICCNGTGWGRNTGGGGGGAGGSIALISGADMILTGGEIDASGGAGGERGIVGTSSTATASNAGGNGGAGFILLMDQDGEIEGFLPEGENTGGTDPDDAEEYDDDSRGVLTITPFSAERFSSIAAVTELFGMTAANPRYVGLTAATDIVGHVNLGQSIRIVVSSARGSDEDPLVANPGSELTAFEVATLTYENSATKVTVTGDMGRLNETVGSPNREAFVRVRSEFTYQDGVEAALGPYASIDTFVVSYRFND